MITASLYDKPKLAGLAVLLMSFLYGCVATPYQPWQTKMPVGGYAEKKLDENSYDLEFSGNGYSKLEEVIAYWSRRAAELCPDGFTVLAREKEILHHQEVVDVMLLPNITPDLTLPHTVDIEIPYVRGQIECQKMDKAASE